MSRRIADALDPGERALVALSAALAGAGPAAEGETLVRALEEAAASADPRAVEEALVQSYLFLGYPAALNGLARWREVAPPARDVGTGEEEASADATAPSHEELRARGERVCRRVYAGQYDRLRANVRALHPDMERWMVEEGYGKVLGRPGLSLRVRELCIAAVLAVVDAPRQLHSHLRGALHAGATAREVEAALEVAAAFAKAGARERAAAVWARVRERAPGGPESGVGGV